MQITIQNNMCKLTKGIEDSIELRMFLNQFLTLEETVKKINYRGKSRNISYQTEIKRLYTKDTDEDGYYFPRGLYILWADKVKDHIDVVDESHYNYEFTLEDLSDLESVLRPYASFDLREDQVMAVRKSLALKRGIVQLPTGSGKTEIMSATIKKLEERNPEIKILVIEPTDILVTKTSERFNRYHLNSKTYKEIREDGGIDNLNVLVSHTKSLLSDCLENPDLLSDFDAVFWDECQHCKCETWKALNAYLHNVEYAIGLSALAVNEDKLDDNDIQRLTSDEAMVIGSTGPVILYIPARYYIDNNILATPVVFQLECDLSELFSEYKIGRKEAEILRDWHFLRQTGIESEERNELISETVKIFNDYGRRVLILVGTKSQAEDLSKCLVECSDIDSSEVAVSFGGGKSHVLNEDGEFANYSGEIIGAFDDGEFSILISTNHLDEGVDLSNLDVCVLASGGKKDRRIIQRIGRALRVNKTGKYAYIIDFYDRGSRVLEKHSGTRMKLFTETIKAPQELIFNRISIEKLKDVFLDLEGLKDD